MTLDPSIIPARFLVRELTLLPFSLGLKAEAEVYREEFDDLKDDETINPAER